MSKKKARLSPEDRETLSALKRCGWNQVHAAAEIGIAPQTMHHRARRLRGQGVVVPTWRKPRTTATAATMVARLQAAEQQVEMLQQQLDRARQADRPPARPPRRIKRGKEDRVIVFFPDVHGSRQHRAAVDAFVGELERIKPDEAFGLGDIIDCAGFMAEHQVLAFQPEAEYSFEEDVHEGNVFLDRVMEHAGQVRMVEGNHCWRPESWAIKAALRNKVDSAFLKRMVATDKLLRLEQRGIKYYRRSEYYDGLPIQGAARVGKLCVTHGLHRGGNTPEKLLDRYGTNVVYGHTHQWKSVVKRSVSQGSIGAWNLGCLSELAPLWMHGDPTNWAHGFGVFVFSRSGAFMPIPVPIVEGVALPELRL